MITPIKPVTQRDRKGRRYTRFQCSYLGCLHATHMQAVACNVRTRARMLKLADKR